MDTSVKQKKLSIAAQGPLKLPEHLRDGLVECPMSAMEVEGLIGAFGKAVIKWAIGAEMNVHLVYRASEDEPAVQADERSGETTKTLLTKPGSMWVKLPRGRDGSFESVLISKHERYFAGLDEHIT